MSTHEALSKKISDWLEKTGLPLELDAVSKLQAAGFVVEHSPVFADPESEKGREIDVVASTRDPLGLLYFYVAAECKATPNPWVVLVDPSKPTRLLNDCLGVTDPRCLEFLPDDFLSRSEFSYRLRSQQTGGYLLRQAFCGENDPAYAASMSALKASIAVTASAKLTKTRFIFSLPMIVVEAPLFECVLSSGGETQLREVNCSEFSFTAYVPGRVSSRIRIVRRAHLEIYSRRLFELAALLKGDLKPAMEKMLEEIRVKGMSKDVK